MKIKVNINELTAYGPKPSTPEYKHAAENDVQAWTVNCVGN